MTGVIEIRAASAPDVPWLVPLVREYWRFEQIEGFAAGDIGALLTRVIEDARLGRAWLATVDGVPAAYLLAVFVFSLEQKGLTAEIDELFVAPRHRATGVGRRLLAAAESALRDAGCTNIALQLGRGNDAAREFYVHHGYAKRDGYELLNKDLT